MKRSLDVAAVILTSLLLIGLALVSFRGLVDPQSASARFGMSVSDAAGALFYRVYLSRNLVIVATGAIFLPSRQWRPLAVLVTVTAVLSLNGVTPPAFHPVALALIVLAAVLLWRRAFFSKI